MLIDTDLLHFYGAENMSANSSQIIFRQDSKPLYYYQIINGRIKLNHYDEDGREIIQSILTAGQSVCELLLFIDEMYPVNAETLTDCDIIRISKDNFFRMLSENMSVSLDINKFISERLYQKFLLMQSNLSIKPEVRLLGILNYFKSFSNDNEKHSFEVELTRKEMASITGLRTETVIRTIKRMEAEDKVKLKNRKIFY